MAYRSSVRDPGLFLIQIDEVGASENVIETLAGFA